MNLINAIENKQDEYNEAYYRNLNKYTTVHAKQYQSSN